MRHSSWRRHGAAIMSVVAVLALGGPAAGLARLVTPARVQASREPAWIGRVRAYVRAAAEHRPGTADLPAQLVGSWREADVDETRLDLLALQSICLGGKSRSQLPAAVVLARRESGGTSREDALAILGLGDAPGLARAVNLALERGALLHADIAMLVTPFRLDRVGCSPRPTVAAVDGRSVGSGCSSVHWRLGRVLLGQLQPDDPAADRFARLWYHASIVYLLEQANYSDVRLQIAKACELFPDDARARFEHGYYQEALSVPRVQALTGRDRATLEPPSTYMRAAEKSFRLALELDPGLVEARVRLGAILTRLARYRDAAATLQPAVDVTQDPVLRYYAELLLARASEGFDDTAAARVHYERARAAVPTAVAPVLGLARLARSAGDRAGAIDLVRAALETPGNPDGESDPWWRYSLWQSRSSAALLADLYLSLEHGGTP
jgi:hypothetical protein